MRTEELFKELEPPAGGAERFRQQLEQHGEATHHGSGRLWLAGLASVLVAVVIVALLRYPGVPMGNDANDAGSLPPTGADLPAARVVYDAQQFDRLLGRPMQPVELSVAIGDERVAVSEMPSTNSKVRIYQIEGR